MAEGPRLVSVGSAAPRLEPERRVDPAVRALVPELAAELAPGELTERTGSLLFSDISGFTALSERLARQGPGGADEMAAAINVAFEALLSALGVHGGQVLSFGGDALLSWFEGADHGRRAAAAAARVRRALAAVSPLQTSAGSMQLQITQGLHSGAVHFLRTADREQALLVVTGPGASIALALESAARTGQVLLSPDAAEALPASATRPLDVGMPARVLRRAPDPGIWRAARPRSLPDGLDVLVPPQVRSEASELLADPEHRLATIAFLKVDGTDLPLAAGRGETLASQLSTVVTAVVRRAAEHAVTVLTCDVSPDGLKLLLAAGVPHAHEADAEAVLRVSRAVLDVAADGALGSLRVRAGVTRGRVYAGVVGTIGGRCTYTVMGDTVNLAARLAGHAGPGEVLAAQAVVDACPGRFAIEPLEPFAVRGKAEPVQASIVGHTVAIAPPPADETPMIGRDDELEQVLRLIERSSRRQTMVIDVVGEAGAGKTRLVDEVCRRRSDLPHLRLEASRFSTQVPYALARQLLRGLAGIGADATVDEAGVALTALVSERTPHLQPWLPLLAAVVEARVAPTQEVDELSPAFRGRRLHATVGDLVAELLDGPSVLVIEDWAVADHASRDLLLELWRVGELPWCVLRTHRPDAVPAAAPDAGPEPVVVRLEPLADAAAAALLELVHPAALLRSHVDAMVARAHGNPLLLTEMAKAGPQERLPDSVEALVSRQLDELPAADRRLLRYASVLGRDVDLELLAHLHGGAHELSAAGYRLREFVRTEGRRWTFRHELFREVAYDTLGFARRRELHGRAVAVLAGQAAGRRRAPTALVIALAWHATQAGDDAAAWTWSREAFERARSAWAYEEAVGHGRAALAAGSVMDADTGERAVLAETVGDTLLLLARYPEARASLTEADQLFRRAGLVEGRLRVARALVVVSERTGEYAQAAEHHRTALRLLGAKSTLPADEREGWRSALDVVLAAVLHRQSRWVECVELCQTAIARRGVPESSVAHAEYLMGLAYDFLGDPRGEEHSRAALPVFERTGDLVMQANVLNNLGVAAYFRGDKNAALDWYARSRFVRERCGDVVGLATSLFNEAEILLEVGRITEARDGLLEARRMWQWAGYPIGVALVGGYLGRVAAASGDWDEASQLLLTATVALTDLQATGFALEAVAARAAVLVEAGQPDRARALALAAVGEAEAAEQRRQVALLRIAAARAEIALGELTAARASLALAEAEATALSMTDELATITDLRSTLT